MNRSTAASLAAAAFVAAIVAANWATSTYGMIPVGLGLTATAGTYLAGLTFVLRDTIQDVAGRRAVLALIGCGAVLSYLLAAPTIAIASAAAFAVSELVDQAIYTPLRDRGYIRAAIASNTAGSVVDTVTFLTIAGFPVWASLPGQLAAKLTVTAVVVAAVAAARTRRRDRVPA